MKRTLPLAAAVWIGMMAGQGYGQTTVIDLRTQSKGVDFSGAQSTKPVRMGSSLPATCQAGELFLLSGAAVKLYDCTAANAWLLVQMSGGGTVNTNDCAKFDAGGNLVSAGAPCGSGGTGGTPVLTPVAFSATPTFLIANATQGFTLTLTGAVTSSTFSGTPTDGQEVWFRICQDGAGGHAFAYPASVTGGDAIDTSASACTSQLFKYIAASASYAAVTAGTSDNTTPGLTTNSGTLNLPAPAGSATLTQTIASGASALGTSAIASQGCAPVVTTAANGVTSTDVVIVTPNASLKAVNGFTAATAGGLTVAWYPTTNAVNFDVCNWSGSSLTPGAVTLNWRVVR